jgi:glycosyltransferase involved in cell wall biosynthesis
MKICLASMAPFLGGAEVAAERLAIGLRDAGHDVLVILGKRAEVYERIGKTGLRCLYVPMYFTDKWHVLRYWRARNRMRSLLQRERLDVIHSNDLPSHQIVSDAARTLGIPRVCHHRFPYNGASIDWLNKFGAERHLFVSDSFMADMIGQSASLRDSNRHVVHDGIPVPDFPSAEDRQRVRQRLGLPLDKQIVLFAGQMIEIKGIADLLRAWSFLEEKLKEKSILVLVGEDQQQRGAYRRGMEKLAEDLKIQARFTGFCPNVADWQMAADVAVVPSHVEPFGLVTVEAMSYGLPVIGTAVGGLCETIVPDETGLLVPPRSPEQLAQALTRLLTSAATRQQFGKAGRRRCEEKFSIGTHTQKVLEEYNQVLHQRQKVFSG